jgi:NhaP-type Na+/H+ or K+/H+ antiporter
MNTKSLMTRTVIVFAALAAAGIVVAVSAQNVADGLQQTIMVALGSALFGASLSFFLVRLFSLVEK